jgi:hypothetical protein
MKSQNALMEIEPSPFHFRILFMGTCNKSTGGNKNLKFAQG